MDGLDPQVIETLKSLEPPEEEEGQGEMRAHDSGESLTNPPTHR